MSSLDIPKKKVITVKDGEDPVSHVKELLPHLGDSFIQVCMYHFHVHCIRVHSNSICEFYMCIFTGTLLLVDVFERVWKQC